MNIPLTFKEFRARHKLSQAKLARKIGVSTRTVERWEAGQHKPSFQIFQHLSLLEKYLNEKELNG